MAEMPIAMWLCLVCIGIPLLILVGITLRFSLFRNAVREAAAAAASSNTYLVDYSQPSAVHAANQAATTAVKAFSGITLSSVNCYILETPISSMAVAPNVYGPNQILPHSADISQFMYQVRVQINGQVDPFLSVPNNLFGTIPGLSAPLVVTNLTEDRVVEKPQGLQF
jgi:hypothetical protein